MTMIEKNHTENLCTENNRYEKLNEEKFRKLSKSNKYFYRANIGFVDYDVHLLTKNNRKEPANTIVRDPVKWNRNQNHYQKHRCC